MEFPCKALPTTLPVAMVFSLASVLLCLASGGAVAPQAIVMNRLFFGRTVILRQNFRKAKQKCGSAKNFCNPDPLGVAGQLRSDIQK
ncbi:hypothetical protein [Herbaspirillum rubrisubalbicans]|uniref:hypothetical protein n=1 Tax=Herbaspirillum rubrisubalbicans TaxID=80842 RepID=UPI0012E3465D|nr:hypothetical protein [Herbaspirillum rubrisubalbicans]